MKQRFRFLLSLFFAAPLSLSLSLFLSAHFLRVFGAGVVANIFGDGRGDWSRLNHRAPFEKYRETVVCSFVSVLNGCETAPSCSEAAHSLSHTHTHTHTHIYTHTYTYTLSLSFSLLLTAEIEGRIFDVFRVWCLIIDAVTDKMSDYGSSARPTESWKMPGDFQIVLLNDAANCCLNGAAPCERKHGHFC